MAKNSKSGKTTSKSGKSGKTTSKSGNKPNSLSGSNGPKSTKRDFGFPNSYWDN